MLLRNTANAPFPAVCLANIETPHNVQLEVALSFSTSERAKSSLPQRECESYLHNGRFSTTALVSSECVSQF